jgi:hypothetical protein
MLYRVPLACVGFDLTNIFDNFILLFVHINLHTLLFGDHIRDTERHFQIIALIQTYVKDSGSYSY